MVLSKYCFRAVRAILGHNQNVAKGGPGERYDFARNMSPMWLCQNWLQQKADVEIVSLAVLLYAAAKEVSSTRARVA